ncbi:DUF998 domain-containing protein [Pseudooctadecabacter jejudonensis]|uniref:DUF998 domain-containing protein n=1 Tax=Pseudooctadecabacter jejudonensis TaxID=1391910 RepID=A0A1Y5SVL1_9RHOB|nr:DUF998 domain-containing protein [Pseudooctadecabacter jejudonensis]SLN46077.1 hypothetical protein PSJ8397_02419 [Pseudooctadecabacter jejudonensis]
MTALNVRLFYWAVTVLVISGVGVPAVIASLRPDYTWYGNYISELGAKDAPFAAFINGFGFLPVALSSAIALYGLCARLTGFRLAQFALGLWSFGLSAGYLFAVLFPCDFGCPLEGSVRQFIHNLSGFVAYLSGTFGLILLAMGLANKVSPQTRAAILCVAMCSGIGFFMMLSPEQADLRGFWQRLADYTMFALILHLSLVLPSPA